MTGYNNDDAPHPTAVVLNDGTTLEVEEYGSDSDGTFYKVRHPRGGTIEIHELNASYYEGWPDAYGEMEDSEE